MTMPAARLRAIVDVEKNLSEPAARGLTRNIGGR